MWRDCYLVVIISLALQCKELEVELSLSRERIQQLQGDNSRLDGELASYRKPATKSRTQKTETIETRVGWVHTGICNS